MSRNDNTPTRRVKPAIAKLSQSLNIAIIEQIIQTLWDQGLINQLGVEKIVIRESFKELRDKGVKVCDALEQLADLHNCSYEKVREIIYNKQNRGL